LRIFKTRWFAKYALRSGIDDTALAEAVERAENGLIDANLGGGVIKQRIARAGGGKSGGYRTVILYRSSDKSFFVYGFAKNERANISRSELMDFRDLADEFLNLDAASIAEALNEGAIEEVR